MVVPAWLIIYGVLFLAGLIVGLLARFFLVLAAVLLVLGAVGLALLAVFEPAALAPLHAMAAQIASDLPISLAAFVTVGGLVGLVGLAIGVLIATPIPGSRDASAPV